MKEILVISVHKMSGMIFTAKPVSIWVMVFIVSGLNYKTVEVFWLSSSKRPQKMCYLDDRVATGRCFDGSSAALGLVVRSVVGFGLHLYLQVILAKLARQWPI